MKKCILLIVSLLLIFAITACANDVEDEKLPQTVEKTTISGSFAVCVRDVIPDYVFDNTTPSVAIVTRFQSPPFTLRVGADIGSKLEKGKFYVFTIEPFTVEYPNKEFIRSMDISSLKNEFHDFRVVDFRLAEDGEAGMGGLSLTIE